MHVQERGLLRLKNGQAALFGYGSLIQLESMESTLGRKYESPRYPCHLRGWKRIWNSIYPNTKFYSPGPEGGNFVPENILYLNIQRADATMNGVVYVVNKSDLPAFDKREYIYARVEVSNDILTLEVTGGAVWAYVGIDPYVMFELLPVQKAAVRSSYLRIVDKGVDEFGQEFRRQYEDSSDPIPASNVIDDRTLESPL